MATAASLPHFLFLSLTRTLKGIMLGCLIRTVSTPRQPCYCIGGAQRAGGLLLNEVHPRSFASDSCLSPCGLPPADTDTRRRAGPDPAWGNLRRGHEVGAYRRALTRRLCQIWRKRPLMQMGPLRKSSGLRGGRGWGGVETEEEREKAGRWSRIEELMWEERCEGGIRALASLNACLSLLLCLLPVALPAWLPCMERTPAPASLNATPSFKSMLRLSLQ